MYCVAGCVGGVRVRDEARPRLVAQRRRLPRGSSETVLVSNMQGSIFIFLQRNF